MIARHRYLSRPFQRWLAALILSLAAAAPTVALDRGSYRLEILADGIPLEEYVDRHQIYVEASEGREYAIRLTNRTGERIAVALSVDGLNTIDAKTTTPVAASKWILGPYETTTLRGWQTGPDSARRFFFTTERESYGAWLGRTTNLGVISAAVFRERRPRRPIHDPLPGRRESGERQDAARPGPQESEAPGAAAGRHVPAAEGRAEMDSAGAKLSDAAATGIGREVDHSVRRVRFDAESAPAALMQIRYEYRDALVSLGVLPRHDRCGDALERRERARGFEGLDFAPDPFR